jgi:hypothetical protein
VDLNFVIISESQEILVVQRRKTLNLPLLEDKKREIDERLVLTSPFLSIATHSLNRRITVVGLCVPVSPLALVKENGSSDLPMSGNQSKDPKQSFNIVSYI